LVIEGQSGCGAHSRPGIVGARPRKLVVDVFDLLPGSALVLHTDGVSQRLNLRGLAWESNADVAAQVLARWGKDHDDAGCFVIRHRVDH
jgi:hypothetical protein